MSTAISIDQAKVYLRQADDTDEALLQRLYAQQRTDELDASTMDALQREVFLRMQYRARQTSYKAHYPTALDHVIHLEDGRAIGRMLVESDSEGMRLVDIALLREHQRRGVGTRLLLDLQQECGIRGGRLRLQVLKQSPAEKLYRRLGFVVIGEDPFRWQMIWQKNLSETQHIPVPKRLLC